MGPEMTDKPKEEIKDVTEKEIKAMNKDAAAFEKKIKTMTEEEFKAMLIKDMFAFEALDEAAFEEEFKNKSEEGIKAMKQFVAALNEEIEAMNKLDKAAK